MRVEQYYSHLNGLEHIQVHKPHVWTEIETVIASVNAKQCKTKQSKEKTKQGRVLYSPTEMNACFKTGLERLGWKPSRTDYWVTADHRLIRKTISMTAAEQ
jgi:hypothetical protein